MVFCDTSKAFDRVWHRGLLHKIAGIGCSDSLLDCFLSYLISDRQQRAVLNGIPQTGYLLKQVFHRDRF